MSHLKKDDEFAWVCKRFDLKREEVVAYNSGICYDRIWVTNKEAADKVSEAVRGGTVNGGWYHGMQLGGQSKEKSGNYAVMC